MTKLHYLMARNRGRLPFQELPSAARSALGTQPFVDANWGGAGDWSDCRVTGFPGNPSFSESTAFRIHTSARPKGIPDDIHESYK